MQDMKFMVLSRSCMLFLSPVKWMALQVLTSDPQVALRPRLQHFFQALHLLGLASSFPGFLRFFILAGLEGSGRNIAGPSWTLLWLSPMSKWSWDMLYMLYKLYRLYTIIIGYIMLYKGYWCFLMSFGFGAFPATVTPSLSRLVQRGIHHHSGHLSASTDIAMYCDVLCQHWQHSDSCLSLTPCLSQI